MLHLEDKEMDPPTDSNETQQPNNDDSSETQQPNNDDSSETQQPNNDDSSETQQPNNDDSSETQQPNNDDSSKTQQPNNDDSSEAQQPNNDDSSETQQPNNDDNSEIQQPNNDDSSEMQQPNNDDSSENQQPNNDDSSETQQPNNDDSSETQQPNNDDSSETQQPNNDDSSETQQPNNDDSSEIQQPNNDDSSEMQQPNNDDSSETQQPSNDDSSEIRQPNNDESSEIRQPNNDDSSEIRQPNNDDLNIGEIETIKTNTNAGMTESDCTTNITDEAALQKPSEMETTSDASGIICIENSRKNDFAMVACDSNSQCGSEIFETCIGSDHNQSVNQDAENRKILDGHVDDDNPSITNDSLISSVSCVKLTDVMGNFSEEMEGTECNEDTGHNDLQYENEKIDTAIVEPVDSLTEPGSVLQDHNEEVVYFADRDEMVCIMDSCETKRVDNCESEKDGLAISPTVDLDSHFGTGNSDDHEAIATTTTACEESHQITIDNTLSKVSITEPLFQLSDTESLPITKKLIDDQNNCLQANEIRQTSQTIMSDDAVSLGSGDVFSSSADAIGIKLRPLATLVEGDCFLGGNSNCMAADCGIMGNDSSMLNYGDMVEQGEIIGAERMDEMTLRIANVVGRDDCITGLSVDTDEDMFPPIQISSVTTLCGEPMSPEPPLTAYVTNSVGDCSGSNEVTEMMTAISNVAAMTQKVTMTENNTGADNVESSSLQQQPILCIRKNILQEESRVDNTSDKTVFLVLHNSLVVPRDCVYCKKSEVCNFRVIMKYDRKTFAFLCTTECRNLWATSLPSDKVVEKPRLFFEKICSNCACEMSTKNRARNCFSWEARDFCSRNCLVSHLRIVASSCNMCQSGVASHLIGKYCVRFGSDVRQFCNTACLDKYKNSISVCKYCQKNLKMALSAEIIKEYCSEKCRKRSQRLDIGQPGYAESLPCTVCSMVTVNRFEFNMNNEVSLLCSDPCLNVFRYVNQVKPVTCCLCSRVLNAEGVSNYIFYNNQLRVFCSDSCINIFVISTRKIVTCSRCKVKKYNFDMIYNQEEDSHFCSVFCLDSTVMDSNRLPTVSNGVGQLAAVAMPPAETSTVKCVSCSMCCVTAKALYHMVMSDNSLRNFCSYGCAVKFKGSFGYNVLEGKKDAVAVAPLVNVNNNKTNITPPSCVGSRTAEVQTMTPLDANGTVVERNEAASSQAMQLLLQLLTGVNPTSVCNKSTMCRPSQTTKAVFCRPHPWNVSTQTDSDSSQDDSSDSKSSTSPQVIVPVPIPIYVPTPMLMYNAPCPVPIFVPIPVPIFVPSKWGDIPMVDDGNTVSKMRLFRKGEKQNEEQDQNKGEKPDKIGYDVMQFDELRQVLCKVEENVARFQLREFNEISVNEDDSSNPSLKRSRPVDDQLSAATEPICKKSKIESKSLEPTLDGELGMVAWRHWVHLRNSELSQVSSLRNVKLVKENLLVLTGEDLNCNLCLFLKDLKTPHGETYQADTVFYLLLGIQQHLFNAAKADCIFMDVSFEKFTNALEDVLRPFVEDLMSKVSLSRSNIGMTRITEDMLWESRQLGAHTPQVLLNTLLYFNTKSFKLTTVAQHQALSFVQIVKQWRRSSYGQGGSMTRTTLLRYFPKKSKLEGSTVNSSSSNEMHENRSNPLHCPVKLYEFYTSRCTIGVRTTAVGYYFYPEKTCLPDSPVWFSSQKVTDATIQKMLNRVLLVREVLEALAKD